MSAKTKIAIACQGGGSQTAFTAGALKALCEARIWDQFELVSISGTSGGAVCAALIWFAWEKDENPLWRRLLAFWKDNTAQGWLEQTFNHFVVGSLRLANVGLLPTVQLSPFSPFLQSMTAIATMGHREPFRNFRSLLEAHINFAEVASWGPRAKRPILMIGAANVTTGKLTKFISLHEPIRPEHILASCAVPNIFPAVQIDGDAFWDGLFSDNPPVQELIRPPSVGEENLPEEIWIIKINATACEHVPKLPDDIVDRRNQLEGNISLFHQLRHLEMLNDMLLANAFQPQYLARFIKAPIRIPKSFSTDPDKPYHIPWMEMPEELQAMLDLESKLDRSAANIGRLMEAGEASARRFLEERREAVTPA
ncbi:MAG: patatin-like phospholipase family protein [Acetobacteraceae bacterium]|nr:patatin-like phospholipase family protein [Acetobacteraceae bacterium]MBV8591884.1 patatin-like phospholipase family protein [Acetobacteraceae bacterium]